MRITLSLLTLAVIGSLLSGCASTSTPQTSYLSSAQSVVSDRADMDFKDGNVYFKVPHNTSSATQFSESLNTCVQYHVANYQKNGQGVQVFRSLGYTEAQIINQGSRLCMESKGWVLYAVVNNQVQHVDHNQRVYAAMSDRELELARDLLVGQRAWYLKYAPQVLAVGDLGQ
ncbi:MULTISPECIES: hypothetical protein [Pseudomonas]|uniref:Lipoprotein n=1 Tax=Pseudomonas reactans TaxID=117680 RepID=A0A7Y8G345_9PSED|nr:hypothetical protein [Pseudomonas reactans]NWD79104.1 hypothetical protein [Pseudomonas reactans]NWE90020.1 hypothetical protein [Pseudomonas reactans]